MRKILLFCITAFTAPCMAIEPINQTMVKLGAIAQEIIPLTFDANQYAKPESKVILKKDLADLLQIFKSNPEHFSKRSVSFKASYDVMLDHLEQTQTVLEQKNYAKAREMIKAVPSICVSCHSQDAQNQKLFMGLGRSRFASDFDYAEFSFVTRDYHSSITYYDRYLTSKGGYKSKVKTQQALERLLTLYAQVDKDPALAATYLNEYVDYIVDYPDLKILLQQWIVGLKEVNDYFDGGLRAQHPIPFASIQNYATSFLFTNAEQKTADHTITLEKTTPEADKVKFIVLRGILFDYLNEASPTEKEKPMLLYWLALCDRKLNYGFYNSFSDIFLKECFTKYPNHPYAKLCKKEYDQFSQTALNQVKQPNQSLPPTT